MGGSTSAPRPRRDLSLCATASTARTRPLARRGVGEVDDDDADGAADEGQARVLAQLSESRQRGMAATFVVVGLRPYPAGESKRVLGCRCRVVVNLRSQQRPHVSDEGSVAQLLFNVLL